MSRLVTTPRVKILSGRLRMYTLAHILRAAKGQLDAAHIDAPAHTARLLLSEVLGQPKEWLVGHSDQVLDAPRRAQFDAKLQRVIAHEPLFYVLGHREFFGIDLWVDKRVLIPRPETEMLVELALSELSLLAASRQSPNDSPPTGTRARHAHPASVDLLDVGTGSGAIPIAVAKHAPLRAMMAIDVSADALDVARVNAQRHGVEDRIVFIQADLLSDTSELPRVITANLPYVTREEIDDLPPQIQAHEPRVALDGGEDGLVLVRQLLGQIAALVARSNGQAPLQAAFLECGASQGSLALDAARRILPQAHSQMLKDLAGLDRVLAVRFNAL